MRRRAGGPHDEACIRRTGHDGVHRGTIRATIEINGGRSQAVRGDVGSGTHRDAHWSPSRETAPLHPRHRAPLGIVTSRPGWPRRRRAQAQAAGRADSVTALASCRSCAGAKQHMSWFLAGQPRSIASQLASTSSSDTLNTACTRTRIVSSDSSRSFTSKNRSTAGRPNRSVRCSTSEPAMR
jgi:hypothetical protein